MVAYVLRRLLAGVTLLFVVVTIAFTLLYVGSGDVARKLSGDAASQEAVAQRAHQLGLDRPLLAQFLDWIRHALGGDLGRSWYNGQLVTQGIASRLSVTLSLVIGTALVTAVVAVALGVLAAVRGGWIDRAVQLFSVVGFIMPGFLVALLLTTAFAVQLHWFPATGYVRPSVSIPGWLHSVTLPVAALSLAAIANVTAQVRGAVMDGLRQEYVRTLRARGLPLRRVVFRHVLRNAAGPALSVLGLQIIGLIGGAVIVERVYAIPGLGQLAVNATVLGDMPVVMGLVVVTTALVVVINLAIDIAQGLLTPKVRLP